MVRLTLIALLFPICLFAQTKIGVQSYSDPNFDLDFMEQIEDSVKVALGNSISKYVPSLEPTDIKIDDYFYRGIIVPIDTFIAISNPEFESLINNFAKLIVEDPNLPISYKYFQIFTMASPTPLNKGDDGTFILELQIEVGFYR